MTMSENIPNEATVYENDEELNEILDTLIEMHQQDFTSTFDQDHETIERAITLNEQMQEKVLEQLNFIDTRINSIDKSLADAKLSANAENRFGDRIYLHRKYSPVICYFDQSELKSSKEKEGSDSNSDDGSRVPLYGIQEQYSDDEFDEEDEEEEGVEKQVPSQAWSRRERDKLIEGIRAEAKRSIALEYIKNKEDWRIWELDNMNKDSLDNFPVSRLDWDRISSIYVNTRTARQCIIQWTTQEHPIINKTPWSKKESEKLFELVEKYGLNDQWEQIASELDTNRTISQCFSRYMAHKNNAKARSLKWTPEEDKKLTEAVKLFGNCNWQQIAATLKGRTGQQCLHRWAKSLNPTITKKRWTEKEDKLLKRAVQLYGMGNWTKVQRLVPGRTDMQCRERWVNVLRPELNANKFTEEELEKLIKLVEEHGPKWSSFIAYFPGRTDNQLLRCYQHYMTRDQRAERTRQKLLKQQEKLQMIEDKKKRKEQERAEKAEKKKKRKRRRRRRKGKNSKGDGSVSSADEDIRGEFTDDGDDTVLLSDYTDDEINDDEDEEGPVRKRIKSTQKDKVYKPKFDVPIPTTVRKSARLKKGN